MLCCMTVAWAEDDGFVTVASASQMYKVLSGNAHAKVRLTADIYLSDLGADFGDTFCSTFYGILDGDGHAIKGDHYADNTTQRRNRTYLFTYSDGATIKNITFKHINKSSTEHDNQCVLTSQAKNNCVFENITFDNCGASCDNNPDGRNAGAAAGYAENCTFTNITVKNSDFTVKSYQVGAVVGYAENCTFTNIKVENCENTAKGVSSGGVAGRAKQCKFNNVEVHGTIVKSEEFESVGGVVGYSISSDYTNCIVDDQSCICADGEYSVFYGTTGEAGGIAGDVHGGSFTNCINSALVAADGKYIGGIAGRVRGSSSFEDCLNTGMVISMDLDDVESFYNKYKTKSGLDCVTKTYKGKEYVIRKYKAVGSDSYVGGIVGESENNCTINRCANLGSVYSTAKDYVGGIAGRISLGKVTNCLVDFHAGSDTDAICAAIGDDDGGECFIGSCLNMTTYKDFSAYSNNWDGFKSDEKNYSLTTNKDAHHVNRTTADKIKSGEICLLLGEAWEQNIATDAYPTPTGNKGLYHTRTVSNQYGTVCVPFAVKSDDKISYYRLNAEKVEGQDIKLVFKYVEENQPGFPVLFRAAEAKDADADNPVDIFFSNAGDAFTRDPKADFSVEHWALYGTFKQEEYDDNPFALISSKTIYYISGGEIRNAKKVTIAPYCAWFLGPNIDTLTGKTIRFVIDGEDDEITSITPAELNSLPREGWGGASFTLMGTKAPAGYRGIVIKNGKKVVIK